MTLSGSRLLFLATNEFPSHYLLLLLSVCLSLSLSLRVCVGWSSRDVIKEYCSRHAGDCIHSCLRMHTTYGRSVSAVRYDAAAAADDDDVNSGNGGSNTDWFSLKWADKCHTDENCHSTMSHRSKQWLPEVSELNRASLHPHNNLVRIHYEIAINGDTLRYLAFKMQNMKPKWTNTTLVGLFSERCFVSRSIFAVFTITSHSGFRRGQSCDNFALH